ncbi:hypothetical protein KIN20_003474 [Parelaphostrongylus tenuis]|uniref:Uncharacterized protein n=1 Tax=Parelaphostrongylus tenuis TaxID=148309 RepID=A0AAD5QG30_PARTN|nr:hypothetical protein KIN20_003474 [Parelaphostrongylus tenuis]
MLSSDSHHRQLMAFVRHWDVCLQTNGILSKQQQFFIAAVSSRSFDRLVAFLKISNRSGSHFYYEEFNTFKFNSFPPIHHLRSWYSIEFCDRRDRVFPKWPAAM